MEFLQKLRISLPIGIASIVHSPESLHIQPPILAVLDGVQSTLNSSLVVSTSECIARIVEPVLQWLDIITVFHGGFDLSCPFLLLADELCPPFCGRGCDSSGRSESMLVFNELWEPHGWKIARRFGRYKRYAVRKCFLSSMSGKHSIKEMRTKRLRAHIRIRPNNIQWHQKGTTSTEKMIWKIC